MLFLCVKSLASISLKVHCQHAKPPTPNLQSFRLCSFGGVDNFSRCFYQHEMSTRSTTSQFIYTTTTVLRYKLTTFGANISNTIQYPSLLGVWQGCHACVYTSFFRHGYVLKSASKQTQLLDFLKFSHLLPLFCFFCNHISACFEHQLKKPWDTSTQFQMDQGICGWQPVLVHLLIESFGLREQTTRTQSKNKK